MGWVETTYGVHLIEVLDRRSEVEEAQRGIHHQALGCLCTATARDAYAMASEFAINATDKESLMSCRRGSRLRHLQRPTALRTSCTCHCRHPRCQSEIVGLGVPQ